MPYNSWIQFRRQRVSVGLPVTFGVLAQEYPVRPMCHSLWNQHDTFSPADSPLTIPLEPWVHDSGGIITIQKSGMASELLGGVQYYGALLEALIARRPAIIRGSAGGAVLHDRSRDRLYYAASRWIPGISIHPTLTQRVQQLPMAQGPGGTVIPTLVPTRHAQTCAEFQALNWALSDGAVEQNLDVWCFRARTMEPRPRCPNCRITVPRSSLGRIWTC